jgi:cation diffusion facilitator family transporter
LNWLRKLIHLVTPHSHDNVERSDAALEKSEEGIRALKLSLAALIVTGVAQLVIVFISGSAALLADTIHNFSDALTAVPLWVAFLLGRRQPTKRLTYGYGRAEDIAGLFIVLMIALSAFLAGWESVDRLINPREITNLGWVATAGVVGFIGNELVALYRIRVGKHIGSAALVADGHHARADGLTSLAVVLGTIGVALGFPQADPIVGLGVTATICVVLWSAAKAVLARLMDSVDPVVPEQIGELLAGREHIVRVRDVQARWIGHRIDAEAAVEVDASLSLRAALETTGAAERAVLGAMADVDRLRVRLS